MSKLSRGATRSSAGKKKAKKRSEARPATRDLPSVGAGQPVQPRENGEERSGGTVVQFRPRAREAVGGRAATRAGGPARGVLQAIDYSYVYTDLKIIGGLSVVLFGGLIALSLVIR